MKINLPSLFAGALLMWMLLAGKNYLQNSAANSRPVDGDEAAYLQAKSVGDQSQPQPRAADTEPSAPAGSDPRLSASELECPPVAAQVDAEQALAQLLERDELSEQDKEFMARYQQKEITRLSGALIAELSKQVDLRAATASQLGALLETKLRADQELMDAQVALYGADFDPEIFTKEESELSSEQLFKRREIEAQTENVEASVEQTRRELAVGLESVLDAKQLRIFSELEASKARTELHDMVDMVISGMLDNVPDVDEYQRDQLARMSDDFKQQPLPPVPLGSTVSLNQGFAALSMGDATQRFFEEVHSVFTAQQIDAMQHRKEQAIIDSVE